MSPAAGLALDIVGGVLVLAGTFLVAVAAVGLLRLRDAYLRMNAVTKAASLGVVLVLAGVAFLDPSWPTVVKVLIAIGLQLLTAPVAGFALGRAAYRAGTPLSTATRYDELGNAMKRAGERRSIAPPSDPGRI